MTSDTNIKGLNVINPHIEELMNKNLIRYRNDCNVWQIDFTHPHIKGKRIRFNTSFKKNEQSEARKEAEKIYLDMRIRNFHKNLFSEYTLDNAIEEYIDERQTKSKTDLGILKVQSRELGHRDIKQLTSFDIKKLRDVYRKANNKPITINRKLDILKAVLNTAKDNEWIDRIPKIKKIREDRTETGYRLNRDEQERHIQAMTSLGYEYLIDPFKFSLLIGLRRANMQGLKKSHIVQTIHGKQIQFKASEMKANKGHKIMITRQAQEIIDRNISEDSEYIFKGFKGKDRLGDFKNSWNTVRAVAGVLNPNTNRYIRWHDLRHTCASEYAEKGMTSFELMNLMGWSSLKMAERYTHQFDNIQIGLLERYETKFVTDLSRKINVANESNG